MKLKKVYDVKQTWAIKTKVMATWLAFKRPDTPILAKIIAVLTVVYAFSPIDLIPDFIPVLGLLDDLIILPILIALCIKLMPKEIFAECETQAQQLSLEDGPKHWYFALPFVLVWILLALICVSVAVHVWRRFSGG